MAVGQADSTSLEPVVILGLLNSMAVVVGNAETLLNIGDLCAEPELSRQMLERISAHARVVTDALELAVRDIPPSVIEVTSKPEFG
jgi:hypothetical protein